MPEQPRQEEWSPQPGTPSPQHARRRRLSRLTVIGGVVILTLAGALTWFLFPRAPVGPSTAPASPSPTYPPTTDIPPSSGYPEGITTGSDGNLWFTEVDANKIGRITTDGTITEFRLPPSDGRPRGIAAGPDGNLWFTEWDGSKIGRITRSGTITEFSLPDTKSRPWSITAGPDGNLWFTEAGGNKIGRIT
ncbi:MAG TPA: hypothetical protein VFV38_35265, partial [Ktedonobacteraceae bacterium]|nr:hypothetical protein [Ktedonobacteraceae bacterium]